MKITITPEPEKKVTSVEISATREERVQIAKLFSKVMDRMIFDIDAKRLKIDKKSNIAAIQGAPDRSGQTDPIMYIKLHNFLKQFKDAIATEAVATNIDMLPNVISDDTGDATTNRVYTRQLAKLTHSLDSALIKRKDVTTVGNIWGRSTFSVKGVFDLSSLEGLTSGKDIVRLMKAGKVVPEYGSTKVPPLKRWGGLVSGGEVPANRAFVVIVQDNTELTMAENLQTKIPLKNWSGFIKGKKPRIKGLGATIINGYREYQSYLKPKTKMDMLQMAVVFATGINESLIGPKPIIRPQVLELEDPDMPTADNRRRYYIITVGGYSGARAAVTRPGMEAALTDVQVAPVV